MAHRESIGDPTLKDYLRGAGDCFWSVSSAVGYGCKNHTEDVRLVQFFLNRNFFGARLRGSSAKYPEQLKMDGKFGGKTWAAIKTFQRNNGQTVIDGMVSAPPNGKLYTKSGWAYTIYILNGDYLSHFPANHLDITRDPGIPNELLNHLSGPLPDLM